MISVNNAIMPWQCLFALLVNTMISKGVLQIFGVNLHILFQARPFQDNWKNVQRNEIVLLTKR
jgi:hypothetical protein